MSLPVAARASRIADIAASVPEETSRTCSTEGTIETIRSASWTSASVGTPKEVPRDGRLDRRPRRSPSRRVPEQQRSPRLAEIDVPACRRRPRGRRRHRERRIEGCHRPHRTRGPASSRRRGSFASLARRAPRTGSRPVSLGMPALWLDAGRDRRPRRHRAAAERIAGRVRRTPVLELGEMNGASVVAKLELLQHTGSFKPRGAFNKLLSSEVPPAGVIAASGRQLRSRGRLRRPRDRRARGDLHPVELPADEGRSSALAWCRRHDRRGVLRGGERRVRERERRRPARC